MNAACSGRIRNATSRTSCRFTSVGASTNASRRASHATGPDDRPGSGSATTPTRRAGVVIGQSRRRRLARTRYVDDLQQDARHALRILARSPGFAAAAVLTLAVGLTGTLLMVTVVDGVLLRPLPVHDEAALLVGWRGLPEAGARRWPFSAEDLDLLRAHSRRLAGVAGVGYHAPATMPLADGSAMGYVRVARVTGEFFDVLGVEPLLGRALRPEDNLTGTENVVVLTHPLWQARFGGVRDVLDGAS